MENPFNHLTQPNCFKGHQYALDVLDGKIVACIYIIGSAKRYLRDLENPDLYMDSEWAEKFMRMFQNFEHVIGDWPEPKIILESWQCFYYLNIEGFYWTRNDKRKYKETHLEVARGNGKSAMLSVTGLIYLSLYRTVKGNKVYSSATKQEQARIVLDSARQMAKSNDSFLKHSKTEVFAHHIAHSDSGSEFRALASDAKSLDGLQPILAIIDELHSHKDRKLYDVLSSAMSKRKDSVLQSITTAGDSLDNIGYSQSRYAKKVALDDLQDEAFFSLVFTLDDEDDWRDEANWIKANPNIGISVDIDTFRSKSIKAKNNPQDETNFKIKHLNLWQNAMNVFFEVKKWRSLGKTSLKISDFVGKKCYVGIDLASTVDLTSVAYVFYDKERDMFSIFTDNFCPQATIEDSRSVMYPRWVDNGDLIATQGEAINFPKLQEALLENFRKLKVLEAFYDPWNAREFAQRLLKERVEMVEFRMNTGNLSEPMKKLDAIIREGRVEHNGSELLSWCLGNVVAKCDANDNVFPRQEHETMKIDPIVAIIMALAGWVRDEAKQSVYEERGMIYF